MIDVLLVCTGDTCRSPMAAVLLGHHLRARGVRDARVHSAGTVRWAAAATDGARAAVAERGLDLTAHESRPLTAEAVAAADLVLGMTRDHVGRAVALDRSAIDKAFLLGEIVRLGRLVGPVDLGAGERVAEWVAAVAARRPQGRRGIPGRASEEVADPAGQPLPVYRRTAAQLDRLTASLADLLTGTTGTGTARDETRQQ